jgi:hypothetical protein
MTDMNQNIQPTDARDVIQRLTQAFGKLPQVLAVVLGGSRAALQQRAFEQRHRIHHAAGHARRASAGDSGRAGSESGGGRGNSGRFVASRLRDR